MAGAGGDCTGGIARAGQPAVGFDAGYRMEWVGLSMHIVEDGGTAPPSVLPDISPTRGEIGCRAGFANRRRGRRSEA
ncbi:hypothetical protein FJ417_23675, partial [Mesorhizobium sp. B3-1-7]